MLSLAVLLLSTSFRSSAVQAKKPADKVMVIGSPLKILGAVTWTPALTLGVLMDAALPADTSRADRAHIEVWRDGKKLVRDYSKKKGDDGPFKLQKDDVIFVPCVHPKTKKMLLLGAPSIPGITTGGLTVIDSLDTPLKFNDKTAALYWPKSVTGDIRANGKTVIEHKEVAGEFEAPLTFKPVSDKNAVLESESSIIEVVPKEATTSLFVPKSFVPSAPTQRYDPKSDDVTVVGAVYDPGRFPFAAGADVSYYTEQAKPTLFADRVHIYLISHEKHAVSEFADNAKLAQREVKGGDTIVVVDRPLPLIVGAIGAVKRPTIDLANESSKIPSPLRELDLVADVIPKIQVLNPSTALVIILRNYFGDRLALRLDPYVLADLTPKLGIKVQPGDLVFVADNGAGNWQYSESKLLEIAKELSN